MRRRWLSAAAAVLCCLAPVRAADRGRAALLPAHTFKGSVDNGPVLTAAFRALLEKEGFRVVDAKETEAALKRLNLDLTRPQFLPGLAALGRELKVRCVVYPRISGVGIGVNQQDPEEFQATIVLNVADPEKNRLDHVFQIGQVFRHPDKSLERAVLPKEAAAEAARRLCEGFFKKLD